MLTEDRKQFLKWVRKNVTLRGIKTGTDMHNGVYGSFGKGLYTAALSNRDMAKQYGTVFYVTGAIPDHPYTVNTLNDAEILRQSLVAQFCRKNNTGGEYDERFFNSRTSMEDEMRKNGYNGLIIRGREMVHYDPVPGGIKYFATEEDLYREYLTTRQDG